VNILVAGTDGLPVRTLIMKILKLLAVVAALLLPVSVSSQTASPAAAMALEQQGKLSEAVEAWRAVTEHNPRDAGAFAGLGVALARETRYKDAEAAYRDCLGSEPAGSTAQSGVGGV